MRMKQKLFSIIALLLMAVSGAWAQGYTVTLKGGTEDATSWQGKAGEGLPTTGSVWDGFTIKDIHNDFTKMGFRKFAGQ